MAAEDIIADALVRIRRDQQHRHLQRRAGSGNPDAARFRFLDALDGSPTGLPISRIADAIGVDRPRAGRLTTQLLAEGRITRETGADDSRYALISLTEQGRELVSTINENRRRAVAAALTGFTAAESRTLATLLHRFLDAWPREP